MVLSCPAADTPPQPPTPRAPAALIDPVAAAGLTLLPEVLARVGDWPITRDLVWPRLQRKIERTLAAGDGIPEALLRYLARPVLNAIIEQHLLGPKAAAGGFAPDLARAKAHLSDLLHQPQTRAEFEALLQENGITREQYLDELALRTAITDWVRQTFVVVQEAPLDELQRLYDSRRQQLRAPETRRLERIIVPTAAGAGGRDQAQQRIAALRHLVRSGIPLAAAVETYAKSGADPGPGGAWEVRRVALKELPPEIEAALAHLDAGEISSVIELPDAFAVVRWQDLIPGRQPSFADVESGLRENLKEEKGRSQFRTYLAELRQQARVVVYPPLEERPSAWPGLPAPADAILP